MVTITVCIGSSCHLKGSYDVVKALEGLIKEKGLDKKVTLKASFCLGECTKAVSVKVDNEAAVSVSRDNVDKFFNELIMSKL